VVRLSKRLTLLFIVVFLITACGEAEGGFTPQSTALGAYGIDPLFREFYDLLGGPAVLGPAITPSFEANGRRFQYVQAGCMEYDPDAPNSERFHLSPLGLEMNIQEPAVAPPAPDQDELYVDGQVIYKGFVDFYRSLGGARFVGRPLTGVHHNPDKKRYEQYFENLGFFWLESEPPETVRLLAYGSWKCAQYCETLPPVANEIMLPVVTPNAVTDLFTGIVSRLGPGLTGFSLTSPYLAEDGMYEQVFEALVLTVDAQNPANIFLRPLPEKIGILAEQAVSPNGVSGMVFWPTGGDLGHNVPQAFIDFIVLHGGTEVSGNPISELFLSSDQVFRQCFTNYCLDYHMGAQTPDALRIRPATLGYTYKELYYRSQDTSFAETQDLHEVSLQVWEKHPFVTSAQAQEIGASLFEGTQPLRNVEPVLILTMPDGSEQSVYFPPTSLDGQSVKVLDPINAPNGTLIPYQVCISSLTGERFCVKDSFVIWGNE
jgi:hypothetical protein